VTSGPGTTIALEADFARALPELAVPWQATTAPEPTLLLLNDALAAQLGLDADWLRSSDGRAFLLGNLVPDGATPVAQGYSGHQFGGYSPRLGDGRALLLGELRGTDGVLRDLHLKGSGATPFSRGGDGLAAVGPMLREYVISEAMHALGIPTTRALAVVATGQPVYREQVLPGAVLARVAASHLRVGSFQYAAALDHPGLVGRLADYAIARHYPEAASAEQPYLAFFNAVAQRQAALIAQWMLVGFIHGVMNTDNMTISGETIDYGPCAFMDVFDPSTVFSSIDHGGRYAYANQAAIGAWNLARFAETLLPLLADDRDRAVEIATEALNAFGPALSAAWQTGLTAKVGLTAPADEVVDDLLVLLRDNHIDFTSFFRALAKHARGDREPARGLFPDLAGFDAWAQRWTALGPDADLMDRVNPVYIPRNHLVEEALAAATTGDLDPVRRLLVAVSQPFEERPGFERYAEPSPGGSDGYRTFCGT
jgi:serine/tyrosine/threonine adenylyltransferase